MLIFAAAVGLAETLLVATDGKLNLYEKPEVEQIARFPKRLEIQNGLFPAYADSPVDVTPNYTLTEFLSGRYENFAHYIGFSWGYRF